MPAASVIGGTTPLPRSDEIYVTKVWTVLAKVAVSVRLKVRSKKRNLRLLATWFLKMDLYLTCFWAVEVRR